MKIFSNSAVSLDGKLSPTREQYVAMGSVEDRRRMHEIRLLCDAILMGGATFRLEPGAFFAKAEVVGRAVLETPIFNVLLTRTLDWIKPGMLDHPRVRPLILAPHQKLSEAFPYPVEFCDEELTPEWIVSVLKKQGINNLLIEAGGRVLLPFLAANLLHEMYVTICPSLVCDPLAPGLCDGAKPLGAQMKKMQLIAAEKAGQEIFTHYRVL